MRVSLLKAIVFIAAATATFGATGPLIGLLAAMTGTSSIPVWAYAGAFSVLLLAATSLALMFDGTGLESLGLAPSRSRVREFSIGFAVGAVLFAVLALVRGATVEVAWTFTGLNAIPTACAGLVTAFRAPSRWQLDSGVSLVVSTTIQRCAWYAVDGRGDGSPTAVSERC